jgi:sugar/nucleoside kinase (ribokinase family)
MQPRIDLFTVGEAFEDIIFVDLPRLPGPGEEVKTSRFVRTIGGGAVITAVAAARLGLRCGVLSGLSREAAARLRAEKIKVRNLRRSGEPHAVSAALSTRTDRSFVTFNGINDELEVRLLKAIKNVSARHVHFALYPHDCRQWLGVLLRLRSRSVSTSWDFGWNEGLLQDPAFTEVLHALDYLFLNEMEAVFYSGGRTLEDALAYWKIQPEKVIVKLGEKGCVWPARSLGATAPRVTVVDTTGAGDAFNGGFLYGLIRGLPPKDCLRTGTWVGSMSTRAAGGLDGLPRKAELERGRSRDSLHSKCLRSE